MASSRLFFRIITYVLIIVLVMPFVFPYTIYASSFNIEDEEGWLRGVILVVVSLLLNHFMGEEEDSSEIEKENDFMPAKPSPDRNENNNNNKEVLGFYVNWMTGYSNSQEALEENKNNIDMVAPFWYTLNPDGEIENRYGGHQYEVTTLAEKQDMKVLPLINNNQANNNILTDSRIREKAVNNVVKLIKDYNYDGVNVDFEFIPAWTRQGYTNFIKLLSEKMPEDKLLTVSVFPKIDVPLNLQGAYDYGAIAPHIDRMVIMTYDHHWSSGPAGPIAPINWVEKNIEYTLEYITPEKLLLGIANYGYDWPKEGKGQDLSTKKALDLAEKHNAKINWQETYKVPHFQYQDSEGINRKVWFENARSTSYKLELVKKYNLRGIGIWRLGNGKSDFWETIKENLR